MTNVVGKGSINCKDFISRRAELHVLKTSFPRKSYKDSLLIRKSYTKWHARCLTKVGLCPTRRAFQVWPFSCLSVNKDRFNPYRVGRLTKHVNGLSNLPYCEQKVSPISKYFCEGCSCSDVLKNLSCWKERLSDARAGIAGVLLFWPNDSVLVACSLGEFIWQSIVCKSLLRCGTRIPFTNRCRRLSTAFSRFWSLFYAFLGWHSIFARSIRLLHEIWCDVHF